MKRKLTARQGTILCVVVGLILLIGAATDYFLTVREYGFRAEFHPTIIAWVEGDSGVTYWEIMQLAKLSDAYTAAAGAALLAYAGLRSLMAQRETVLHGHLQQEQ